MPFIVKRKADFFFFRRATIDLLNHAEADKEN
jgi:hypothetical protein